MFIQVGYLTPFCNVVVCNVAVSKQSGLKGHRGNWCKEAAGMLERCLECWTLAFWQSKREQSVALSVSTVCANMGVSSDIAHGGGLLRVQRNSSSCCGRALLCRPLEHGRVLDEAVGGEKASFRLHPSKVCSSVSGRHCFRATFWGEHIKMG